MKTTRINLFIILAILYVGCNSKTTQNRNKVDELNIVLIHVDDLGWTDIGVFGSDFYETPNIDRLAAEGLRFTNSYAAAAICSPTRVALLTGKYPARTGITDWIRPHYIRVANPEYGSDPSGFEENGDRPLKTPQNQTFMPLEEVTIAEQLKERGYQTAHIGKWHLGSEEYFPEHQGFDLNIGGCDLGQPPSYFDPYLAQNGNEEMFIPNITPRKEGEYLTDREGDEAVKFIADHQDEKFFLHWATYAVHTPLMGKEDLVEKYRQKKPGRQHNPVYAAMIESLDDNVGKLMKALDSLGLSEKTLVIFTSDNGGLMADPANQITNNAPLRSQKGYPYEGGIRVPTIMKWPGKIPAGKVTDSPLMTIDILPTVLGVLDGNQDEKNWDGIDYATFIQDSGEPIERDLFWHFPHYRLSDVIPYSIVRSGDYKYIRYYDGSEGELYNLKEDMQETTNLIRTKSEMIESLDTKLDQWLLATNAKMPEEKK